MLVVIGQQQLEVHLARASRMAGVLVFTSIPFVTGSTHAACSDARARIHYAQTARTDLVHVLQIAQSGNIDARLLWRPPERS